MVDPVFVVSRLEGKDGGQGVEKGEGGGAKPKIKQVSAVRDACSRGYTESFY